jgi:hypothetical protein
VLFFGYSSACFTNRLSAVRQNANVLVSIARETDSLLERIKKMDDDAAGTSYRFQFFILIIIIATLKKKKASILQFSSK